MIRAGDLRYKIQIERRTIVKNSVGEAVEVWESGPTLPCAIRPISGREKFAVSADREISSQTYRFIVRYRKDVGPTDRLVYEGKKWDIIALSQIQREGLEITAEAVS